MAKKLKAIKETKIERPARARVSTKVSLMTITLTPEIERALTEEAQRLGTTPEILALDCLREQFVSNTTIEPTEEGQGTLADFLADHIGVLASREQVPGGARMSEHSGQKFAAGLVKKRQQRRL